jgi:hypothetical protein
MFNNKQKFSNPMAFTDFECLFKNMQKDECKKFLGMIDKHNTQIVIKYDNILNAINFIFESEFDCMKERFVKFICRSIETPDDWTQIFKKLNDGTSTQPDLNIQIQNYFITGLCQNNKIITLMSRGEGEAKSLVMSAHPKCRHFFMECYLKAAVENIHGIINNSKGIAGIDISKLLSKNPQMFSGIFSNNPFTQFTINNENFPTNKIRKIITIEYKETQETTNGKCVIL